MTGARVGSQGSTGWASIGRAYANVDWQDAPFASVNLVIDLDTACYPFDKWASDPPPPGQSWPADCDAFDRNLDVFVDDGGASPPFEVIHAVTPFGGPAHLEADVTDLANALPGAHRLRLDLGSFSDAQGLSTGSNAGWTVSARVDVVPGRLGGACWRRCRSTPARSRRAIRCPSCRSWFPPARRRGGSSTAPAATAGPARRALRRAGREFCDRRHQIFVDGATVEDIEPYREDCQTLCTLAIKGRPTPASITARRTRAAIRPACGRRAPTGARAARRHLSWGGHPRARSPGAHTFSFQVSSWNRRILAGFGHLLRLRRLIA
jgi:hypothetical protein